MKTYRFEISDLDDFSDSFELELPDFLSEDEVFMHGQREIDRVYGYDAADLVIHAVDVIEV